MNFPNPYLSNKSKIELLERWLMVQSTLYYKTDTQLVEDYVYDNNGKQLMEYMVKFQRSFRASRYHYVFSDFEGSTGFYLYDRLNKYDKQCIDESVICCEHIQRSRC